MISPVSEAKEKITLPDRYFLAVNSKNIYTTVLVNGVPLVDVKEGESIRNIKSRMMLWSREIYLKKLNRC
jgi:hypothetical protein